ncbi:hypothetical protein Hanom_Chr16g01451031 [Helianthus anomalus]
MELTSRMKMTRLQTFWIQIRKNKPLDESRKIDQTLGTKMTFYLKKHESIWTVSHTCLRTKWFISISPLAPERVRPIITAFPPSLTLCTHCINVLGFPNASIQVSTPIPPVISCRKHLNIH